MTSTALLNPLRRRAAAFLLPLLAGAAAPALAQQHPAPATPATDLRLSPEDQDRGLNGVQKNFWFSTGGEDYKNAGFFGQRLRPYLTDEQAIASLDRYRRQRWLHLSERLVFVGAVGLYGQQVLSADKPQYFNNAQKAAIGVAAACLISNALITRHTNQHFIRAVEGQNATSPAARRMGVQQVLPNFLGLTAPTGRPQLLVGWTLH